MPVRLLMVVSFAIFTRIKLPTDAGNPIVTFTGGSTGNTCIARAFSLGGVQPENVAVLLSSGKNATAANIGPIQMPGAQGRRWRASCNTAPRSDDWTSVATFPAGAFITWEEIFENSSTLGNDGGIVVALGTWSGRPASQPRRSNLRCHRWRSSFRTVFLG